MLKDRLIEALEMKLFILREIKELERADRRIDKLIKRLKGESQHPLYPHKPIDRFGRCTICQWPINAKIHGTEFYDPWQSWTGKEINRDVHQRIPDKAR